jgi:hypothetical protein
VLVSMNAGPEPPSDPPTASHCVALGHVTSFKIPTPAGTDLLVHVGDAV